MTLADGRLFHRLPPRVDRVAQAHATEVVLLERITDLWIERAWWRYNRWADWPDIRREHYAELRALVAVARRARKLAAAELVTAGSWSQADWCEPELREAFGR